MFGEKTCWFADGSWVCRMWQQGCCWLFLALGFLCVFCLSQLWQLYFSADVNLINGEVKGLQGSGLSQHCCHEDEGQ